MAPTPAPTVAPTEPASVQVTQAITYGNVNDYDESAVLNAIKEATGVADVQVERTDYKIAVSYDFSSVIPAPNESQAEEAIANALGVPASTVTITPKTPSTSRRLAATPRRLSEWDAQITTSDKTVANDVQSKSEDTTALSSALSTAMDAVVTVDASAVKDVKTEITLVTKVIVPEDKAPDEVNSAVTGDALKTSMTAAVGAVATFETPTTVVSTLTPTVAPTTAPTTDPTVAPTMTPTPAPPTAGGTPAPTNATMNTTVASDPVPESDSSPWLAARLFPLLVVAAVSVHM